MTTKNIIEKRVKQLGVAIGREKAILQEIENDKMTLQKVGELEEKGVALAEDSHYASYEEWKVLLQKQIKRGENTLDNIVIKRAELEAFEFYLKNKTE